jgi:hypothetical protein
MTSGTDFLYEHFVLSISLAHQISRKLRFHSITVEARNSTIIDAGHGSYILHANHTSKEPKTSEGHGTAFIPDIFKEIRVHVPRSPPRSGTW